MSHPTQLHHLAIICDGNRRWARSQGKPTFFGHREGLKRIPELIETSIKNQIKYLTFWIFSTENWDRSQKEIEGLFDLFKQAFKNFQAEADEKMLRVKFIGDTSKMPVDIQTVINQTVDQTKKYDQLTVTFALNYGGRDELLRAMKKYYHAVEQGQEKIAHLDSRTFSRYLDTWDLPDPDLVIRTSGEQRLSGFLLWQINYSELYFPLVHFPAFNAQQLELAIKEFKQRQRRFGQ